MLRTLTTLACLVPALALAQNVGAPLLGKSLVVNNGPGDQTEPHVSGPRMAYTNQLGLGGSEIRYHEFLTGEDWPIPNEGGYDAVSDISGDTVVFTRTTSASGVFRFNVLERGPAEELAPRPGAERRAVAIGHQTVAWQELGYTAGLQPEIFAYRADTLALTRLSEDAVVDRTPAVSADGTTVVWTKCATSGGGCDIWSAHERQGGYEVTQLTGGEGEESQPDTNGEVVVYVTRRIVEGVSESDIAWQPVGGGEARRLALPGTDANPNVSGPLLAFERRDASSATPNFDIVLYDLRTRTFYRLTDTPMSEMLSDISVDADGQVRVVWSVREDGHLNVYAYVFRLPGDCAPPPKDEEPASVCASPGSRPLLATLRASHSKGKPEVSSALLPGSGAGVLCVDNAHEGTAVTAGWVWLGEELLVSPDELKHDVASLSRAFSFQEGMRTLSARAAGKPGSAFQVRVYGESSCSRPSPEDDVKGGELLFGRFVPSEPLLDGFEKYPSSRYFVPSGYEGLLDTSEDGPSPDEAEQGGEVNPLQGCSAGGGMVSLLGAWVLVSLLVRHESARGLRVRASWRR
jgi:Tol biopolymer transport system component